MVIVLSMRHWLVVVAAALQLGGCCAHQRIGGLAVTAGVMSACDWGQTLYASDHGRWDRPGATPGSVQRELNPLLGATPSVGELDGVFLGDEIAITAATAAPLPRWLKYAILGAAAAAETYMVATHWGSAGGCGGD